MKTIENKKISVTIILISVIGIIIGYLIKDSYNKDGSIHSLYVDVNYPLKYYEIYVFGYIIEYTTFLSVMLILLGLGIYCFLFKTDEEIKFGLNKFKNRLQKIKSNQNINNGLENFKNRLQKIKKPLVFKNVAKNTKDLYSIGESNKFINVEESVIKEDITSNDKKIVFPESQNINAFLDKKLDTKKNNEVKTSFLKGFFSFKNSKTENTLLKILQISTKAIFLFAIMFIVGFIGFIFFEIHFRNSKDQIHNEKAESLKSQNNNSQNQVLNNVDEAKIVNKLYIPIKGWNLENTGLSNKYNNGTLLLSNEKEEVFSVICTTHDYNTEIHDYAKYQNEKFVRNMNSSGIILTPKNIEDIKFNNLDAVKETFNESYKGTENSTAISINFKYLGCFYTIEGTESSEFYLLISKIELIK